MAKNVKEMDVPKKELFDLVLTHDTTTAGRSFATFMTSLLFQGGIVAGMVIIPLMATDNMPTPQGIMSFMAQPPPPPPRRRRRRRRRKRGRDRRVPCSP